MSASRRPPDRYAPSSAAITPFWASGSAFIAPRAARRDVASGLFSAAVSLSRPVLIGARPSRFREELAGWVRGQGFDPFVTEVGRVAVDVVRRTPEIPTFLDADLAEDDVGEVWRVVRPIAGSSGARRLVLLAERRSKELWMTALADGVATVLPLPAERDVVLCALRIVTRD